MGLELVNIDLPPLHLLKRLHACLVVFVTRKFFLEPILSPWGLVSLGSHPGLPARPRAQ